MALLEAAQKGMASLCVIFGGQGPGNPNCLEDLSHLYEANKSFLEDLIDVAASTISRLSTLPDTADFYDDFGFDIKKWLANPDSAPTKDHLATAPFSFPIVTLISLGHYCVACKTLGISPKEFRDSLRGVTGHSQGIIAAAVVATSDGWEKFYDATRSALEISFWIGYESHLATPSSSLSAAAVRDSRDCGEGPPSPMLSINGLNRTYIERLIREANSQTPHEGHIHLALVNSRENTVVSGSPNTLRTLSLRLRKISASEGLDQSRVPFIHRKPVVDQQYLPISGAFHSPCLDIAVTRVLKALGSKSLTGHDMGIALYHTRTGENLQQKRSANLIDTLVRMVTSDMVDWPKVCSRMDVSHILDFGPGRASSLIHELSEGTGLRIVHMSEKSGSSHYIGFRTDLFGPHMLPRPSSWADLYRPHLRKYADGSAQLDTKMTRIFGAPPVMVAGMTPTTKAWDFVAAVMKAGYHIELAGGGYSKPEDFEDAIKNIHATLPIGRGITCNLIYLNPRALAWQIPLLRRLNRDGIQIDGLTIGAGIPSAEVVKEYIETIGLKHISFKPGSYESILQVISLAQGYPNFPIGLQWTGGRAGGHHSFEDFHAPLLKAYSRIRQCSNIILIAGSGFGGADDTLPYLTGEWARSLGYPLMPVDGILLGSRMMVAREAHTSPQVKALIVQAEGLDDSEWFKTYETSSGGFVTVNSEMGQPIHQLATRGALLWKDLDNRIFAIKDKAERLRMLRRNRADIIKRLNRDYAKPWLAVKSTGECVDLQDMTYLEIFYRLVALMYVRHQQRWIHSSYLTLVLDFMKRVQERLTAAAELVLPGLNDPYKLLTQFSRCYPSAETELLYTEDVSYLIGLFRRPGQKPVNFIPRLDDDFETWFKKDSLWQAEDVDAVQDQDAQRICIIQGPVAARHSKVADETAGAILNAISQKHIDMLRCTFQANQNVEPSKSVHDSLVLHPVPKIGNVYVEEQDMQKRYEMGSTGTLPELEALVERVLGGIRGWLHACLTDEFISRGPQSLPNPIRSAFKPGHGDIVVVKYHKNGQIQEVTLSTRSQSDYSPLREALKLSSYDGENVSVTMSAPNPINSRKATISFWFEFIKEARTCRLREDSHRRNERIKEFYAGLWNGGLPDSLKNAGLTSEFPGKTATITEDVVTEFMNAVKKSDLSPSASWSLKRFVPIDICIFVAWTALVKPLLISAIDVDLLNLLHRSNSFKYYPGARPLKVGDVLQSSSRIGAVTIQASGKLIEVVAEIKRDYEAVVKVTSVFFIQGQFSDYERTFQSTQDPVMIITVTSEVLQALILSRDWLIFDEPASSLIGRTFSFRTTTHTTYKEKSSINELKVDGHIFTAMGKDAARCVGKVYFEGELCIGNPVMDFLTRYGSPRRQKQMLESPGSNEQSSRKIRIPRRSAAYSKSSKDTNPIHLCPIFAGYCQLPGAVTHGMYTSAAVRRAVEEAVGDTECARFSQYSASFEGIVLPGDIITVTWSHVAMIDGRMVLSIQAFNGQSNARVLEAEAEIEQASTAYLFCGQGSQEKGMGLPLYDTSLTARAIWDRGDQYLREIYGFSILQIVRDDPKTLTIHFGGKRGQKVRDNYFAMTQKPLSSGPDETGKPMLRGLTPQTTSHTFSNERGLLFSTQFSQPAIVLMEIAEFEHLKSKGLVQSNAMYAGHSLGEYSALGACTTFLSLEKLMDLIFYRGLHMQDAVQRDECGRTEYSMVAANPSRVGETFTQQAFETVINLIGSETQLLLEVVNHNVKQQQYVCAGHLRTLWTLGKVLDRLARHPRPESMASEELLQLVQQNLAASHQLPPVIELERGVATVPLKGIDIPFHSTLLRGEIENYRQYLESKLAKEHIEPEQFVGKFIPNVMGKPFSITRSYVKQVADVTGSRQLLRMLRGMA